MRREDKRDGRHCSGNIACSSESWPADTTPAEAGREQGDSGAGDQAGDWGSSHVNTDPDQS